MLAGPSSAQADELLYDNLNVYEREAVDFVLEQEGLVRDESPEGKTFGELRIVTLEVFQGEIPFLAWANALHATTQHWVIEDEVLWQAEMPFDIELVEETVRNLRTSVNLAMVAMVPVVSAEAGRVDILAVTRDTWSLRFSFTLDFTGGVVNELFASVSERNLAGTHKQLGAIFTYEQDVISVGPRFVDPRLFRTRLNLFEQLLFAVNHETGGLEGTVNDFEIGLPLYSLDSRWGFRLAESHDTTVDRLFQGSRLRTYDNPDTEVIEEVPYEVDVTAVEARALALRGLGRTPRHIFAFGYGVSYSDFDLLSDTDAVTRAAFERDVLPVSELASFVQLSYRFFSGRFATLRNYQTYAVAEDLIRGHDIGGLIRAGPRFLGSDTDFLQWSASAEYTAIVGANRPGRNRLDAGVLQGEVEIGSRYQLQTDDLVDKFVGLRAHLASPQWGPFRLHGGGRAFMQLDRFRSGLQTLGGDSGLRGYSSGAFLGDSRVVGHVELRTLPVHILTAYLGFLLFFDAGTVFDQGERGEFLSNIGLGLRAVIPTAQPFAYRIDYAFPTSGPNSFFPGTLSIGVDQVF